MPENTTTTNGEQQAGRGRDRARRGTGRGNPNGRGRGRGVGRQRRSNNHNVSNPSTFKGPIKAIENHVFQCRAEKPKQNQFTTTVEKLLIYLSVKYSDDTESLTYLLDKLNTPTITKPDELASDADAVDREAWRYEIKSYVDAKARLKQTLLAVYNVIWGQCSPMMQAKLEAEKGFSKISDAKDPAKLLKSIQGICHQFQSHINIYEAIDEAHRRLITCRQQPDESNSSFLKVFKNHLEVLEHYGGSIGKDPGPIAYEEQRDYEKSLSIYETATKKELKKNAYNRLLGTMFLRRSDQVRYGSLLTDLRNAQTLGEDKYPNSLEHAYEMIQNYEPAQSKKGRGRDRDRDRARLNQNDQDTSGLEDEPSPTDMTTGMTYAQQGDLVPGTNGRTHPVDCRSCGQPGHYASHCPNRVNPTSEARNQNAIDGVEFESGNEDQESDDSEAFRPRFTNMQLMRMINNQDDVDLDTVCLSKWAILLDTGSNCNVFHNKSLLRRISRSKSTLRAFTNGGHQDSYMLGELPGFFPVWWNKRSRLNILSYSDVSDHFRITTDTAESSSIFVHLDENIVIEFKKLDNGLYILPDGRELLKHSKAALNPYYSAQKARRNRRTSRRSQFLNTVKKNKANFTRREIQGADRARNLHVSSGMPSYQQLLALLADHYFRNCPVTALDLRRALKIYGPEVAMIKGKRTRPSPKHIADTPAVQIPADIYNMHKDITVCLDFFYVNRVPIFHSISRNYKFRTCEATMSRNKETILQCTNKVINTYRHRELNVSRIMGDGEFECIREDIRPIDLHIAPPNEHIGDIERSIRTIKERTRCLIHDLPYKVYPRVMVEGCITAVTQHLNNLPALDGVSNRLSPASLIVGRPAPDYNELTGLKYGDFCQVYEATDNTPTARTVSAIALHPAEEEGSWYYMSLQTGNKIHGRKERPLPVSEDIIDQVNELGIRQGMRAIENENFQYKWRPHEDFNDSDDEDNSNTDNDDQSTDSDYAPSEHDSDSDDNDTDENDNDDDDDSDGSDDSNGDDDGDNGVQLHTPLIDDVHQGAAVGNVQGANHNINEEQGANMNPPNHDSSTNHATAGSEQTKCSDDGISYEESQVSDDDLSYEKEPKIPIDLNENHIKKEEYMSTRSGRQTKKHDYALAAKHGFQNFQYVLKNGDLKKIPATKSTKRRAKLLRKKVKLKQVVIKDTFKHMVSICMNQMSAKKGIKKHGQVAINAIYKEYAQLVELDTFKTVNSESLTKEQKKEALRLITVVKEKRCGKIKGRACADGRPQRKYIPKEDAASPTVSLESLILSMIIDANEGRDTATADVAGAFLKGEMPDFVLLRLMDEEVDIFCDVDPRYKEHVIHENGHKVLYVQLQKALYGCMLSAVIWYETFANSLIDLGFELNEYDPCVANKIVNGKQLTIAWYVDDMKISHVESKVVDWLIDELEKVHGKMTITRGNKHTFVGMDIEYMTGTKKVKIITKEYIVEAIEAFGEDLGVKVLTPAKSDLFNVNEDDTPLEEEKADIFHSVTAKLLFVSRRSRLDIATAIAFLTTRVSCSTQQDWEKLRRCLSYLKHTIDMPRIISAENFGIMKTWVDASYATHKDMRGHTGGAIGFNGVGIIIPKSSKQKLNTKSSTETEVVGASDYLPWVIWVTNFLKCQGYNVDEKIFFQDNTSAIKMERNGLSSCGDKSRHIHIRYFFIKDVIERENIHIVHCPTELMIADFFTKPLQGKLFRIMRDFIMGLSSDTAEERVGERGKAKSRRNKSPDKPAVPDANDSKVRQRMNDVKASQPQIKKKLTYLEALTGRDNGETAKTSR